MLMQWEYNEPKRFCDWFLRAVWNFVKKKLYIMWLRTRNNQGEFTQVLLSSLKRGKEVKAEQIFF